MMMTDFNPLNPEWCNFDNCPTSICGGPHVEVETTFGTELLKVGQEPLGRLLDDD
jgi:hypothetical protein